jgi:hypothetical protein
MRLALEDMFMGRAASPSISSGFRLEDSRLSASSPYAGPFPGEGVIQATAQERDALPLR